MTRSRASSSEMDLIHALTALHRFEELKRVTTAAGWAAIRTGVIAFAKRCQDHGESRRAAFCREEVARLDARFGRRT